MLFLATLAFGLSTGEILMSIPTIGLAANWLIELKFKEKWQQIRQFKFTPLILLLVYAVYLLWMPFSNDTSDAIKNLVTMLPMLCLPIVLGSSKPLTSKEWWLVIIAFISGLMVSATAGYYMFLKGAYINYRDLSIFISHIRLSLLLGLGILILLISFTYLKSKYRYLLFVPIIYLAFFIRILESGTGYVSLALALILFALFFISRWNNKWYLRFFMLSGLALTVTGGIIVYLSYLRIAEIKDPADFDKLEYKTAYGGDYQHIKESKLLENGYYVWLYVCPEEAEKAWNERSSIPFDSLDKKGQPVYGTLYRFLTSKGLRKDYDGVQSLANDEIAKIESGIVSSVPKKIGISGRVDEVLYEIVSYRENEDPNGHSVIQRMYYLQAGWNLFKENGLWGVSKGDEMHAYLEYYDREKSLLRKEYQLRAHNQLLSFFVCFGILGGVLILFALSFPLLLVKGHFLRSAFLVFVLISFLTDDLFNTQAGITYFAFFYCFLLFVTSKDFYQRSITS